MLRGGRNLCAGHGLNRGTIAQRPDLAFVILQLQAGIDEQLAPFFAAIQFLQHGGRADGTVEINVLQGISMPDCRIALSEVAALSLSLRMISTPRFRRSSRKNRQRLRHFRQNTVASLDYHAAMRFVAQAKVIPFDGMHEIVQLGHYLNAGEAASADNECQELAAQFRVLLDIGFLENVNQVIAQHHGIGKRPKRHRVFDHAGHAVKFVTLPSAMTR